MKKQVTISKKRYENQCSDGCCDESGFEWKVDGKFIHQSPCEDSGWIAILNSFGIEASVVLSPPNYVGDLNATARQRAEAFLRTVGKWEESK